MKNKTFYFDRNIELALSKKRVLIPSDYQFFSYLEKYATEKNEGNKVTTEKNVEVKVATKKNEEGKVTTEKNEEVKVVTEKNEEDKVTTEKNEEDKVTTEKNEEDKVKQIKDFKNFLNSEARESYDTKLFFDSFFFTTSEYSETDFRKFYLDLFKIICPDDLSHLNDTNFLEELEKYEEKFIGKNKFNREALYYWMSLGFARSEYYPSLIPKDMKDERDVKFIIEKVAVLHNLCFLFMHKLLIVYFEGNKKDKLPNVLTVGCLNSENMILVGLRFDSFKEKIIFLTLSESKSFELNQIKNNKDLIKFIDFIGNSQIRTLHIENNKLIYNLHLANCYLLESGQYENEGDLFTQIFLKKFNVSNCQMVNFNLEMHMQKVTTNDFVLPKYKKSKLYLQ